MYVDTTCCVQKLSMLSGELTHIVYPHDSHVSQVASSGEASVVESENVFQLGTK